MPQSKTTTLLGFPVEINNVPTTLSEAIEACGGGTVGEQKLVDKFVGYSNAHSGFTDARSEIVAAVEKVTKIAQKQESETEDGEKDSVYVTRALAESGKSIADILAELVVKDAEGNETTGVKAISVDFNAGTSGRRSGSSSKTPAKTYVDNATKTIEAHKDDVNTLNAIIAGLEKLNGIDAGDGVVRGEDGLPTVDSLAVLLKKNSDRKNAEAKAELAALGIKS